jgi:GT2 family glycosyltransferase
LLYDSDLIADPELVESHVAFSLQDPNKLVCGRVKPYLPAYSTYIERIASPDDGLDRGEEEGPLAFYNCLGGHMLFSKKLYTQIGPFDPELKGFEDIDFAYRATLLRIPIIYNPRAISYHNHPRTLAERIEQARTYNRMLSIIFKRYPEIKGKLPLLSRYETIHWGQDDGRQIMNKLTTQFFGLSSIQCISTFTLKLLGHYQYLPRLVRFLYWRVLIGNWYRGYRDGL